jgi:acetyl-CoA carboxylase biotin carboxylase subunit
MYLAHGATEDAAGELLERSQDTVVPGSHSIECRVNAEDPVTFAPSPGKITGYHQPGGYGVRVDTMAYEQYKVQPYYDSLVAKLVITGATREIALKRAMRALNEYVIEGIKTNIPFHKRVLAHAGFAAGTYDTRIVDQILNPPAPEEVPKPAAAAG